MSFEEVLRQIVREELEPLRREVAGIRDDIARSERSDRRYLSMREAAHRLGVSRATVYEMARDPSFPAAKLRGRMVVASDELDRWVDGQMKGGETA